MVDEAQRAMDRGELDGDGILALVRRMYAEHRYPATEALADAEDMLAQIIDDWGAGLTVCQATKEQALAELKRIRTVLGLA